MRLRIMRLLSVASIGIAALALAAPAYAVNTSFIVFRTMPPSHESVPCHHGTTGRIPFPEDHDISSVQNNCDVRMWLHQYADGTGYGVCIRANSQALIDRLYRQWQVTTNSSSC